MKGLSVNNAGRQSLSGPGPISHADLAEFRARHRLQEVIFDLARGLTKDYVGQPNCEAPPHVLFPQIVAIVRRYAAEKVNVVPPSDIKDIGLAPYYHLNPS
jgi:type III restriction enzyme